MSQNAGLRHAATEPLSLDTKREPRRRGAAGRAAALRRAPSDSDCSAETASLSADSAERVRPLPPPPRANKTRSRRRGSEWEVLEGLKDGQRFERRPEVFNGYLHKKRKWPLKGWHKRFFVVDGGILVYARSPTDVARGRLHGSVDVGLSVISAKARRRRIDIDADEFIYHLRAKTPDVFRTWLNVLKVHRLYRQHLLTFGARESVPKIHAPLEDLPPTDNSSRTTTTFSSSSALSEEECRRTLITAMERNPSLSFVQQIVCYENYQNTKLSPNWSVESEHSPVDECLEEKLVRDPLIVDEELYNHSLCSMNCMAQAYTKVFDGKEMSNSNLKVLKSTPVDTPGDSFNEQAVTTTDLDISSKETSPYIITSEYSNSSSHSNDSCKCKDNKDKSLNKYQVFQQYDAKRTVINKNKPLPQDSVDEAAKIKTDDAERTHQAFSPPHVGKPPPKVAIVDKTNKIASKIKQVPNKIASNLKPAPVSDALNSGVLHLTSKANVDEKKSKPITRPVKPFKKSPDPTALFLFNKRNLRNSNAESPMKKSRKSTNLVKYKNLTQEPPLPKPYVVSCILKPYKRSVRQIGVDPSLVSKVSQGMQISRATPKHKSIQDHITPSERDRMTEKLFMSIFETSSSLKTSNPDIKSYLNQTVMDLYDINSNRRDHPIKKLFKSLLEYWLNNTGAEKIRNKMRSVRSVNTQVENRTRDQALSQIKCGTESVPTQYCSVDILSLTPDPVETPSNQKQITYSFFKERRIQELERLLKNTVYTYEAVCNKPSKQRDMQITKKLINNIEGVATKTNSYVSDTRASCSFSSEYPEIPETFKHILSDTSIPSDVAKEFLQAYLHILNNTRSYSTERTSRGWCCCNKNGSSNERTKHARDMKCDVQTEAVEKKASVGVATVKTNLKDKTTTRTVKSNKTAADICQATFNNVLDIVTTMFTNKSIDDKPIRLDDTKVEGPCNESGRINCPGPLLTENSDDNTIIIDLTNYNLEHMSMTSDSKLKGTKSISIKLKERPPNDESYQKNLNLKFSNVKRPFLNNKQCSEPNNSFGNYLKNKIPLDPRRSFKNPYIDYSPNMTKADLRHCVNDSTGTSKAYKAMYESNLSLNIQNSDKSNLYTNSKKSLAVRDDWSCFLLSSHCKRSSPYFANKKKDKKKRRSRSKNDETSSSHRDNLDKEGVTSQEKKQVIDEQFIMMLLENLTQLSRSTPEIYKDIFSLYSKLKMKQQKYTRKELQAEFAKIKNACHLKSNEIMDYGGSLNISSDRNLEANHLATGFTSTTPSTLKAMNDPAQRCCENNSPKYYTRDAESSRNHLALYNEDIPKVSDLLIIDACLNSKNDSLLRALKLYLENEDSRNFRFLFPNIEKSRSSRNRNKSKSNLSKVDKEHLRETLQLRKRRILKEKLKRDFHIYQICLTDFLRSQSISSRSTNEDLKTIYKCNSDVTSYPSGLLSPTRPLRGPQASFVSGTPGGRLASWIIESGGPLENASRELGQAQLSVQQLQRLLDAIDSQQHHDTDQVSLEGASPSVKKDRRKFGLRKKKSNSKCASIELAPPLHVDASASYMALSALTAPPSPGGGASPAPASAASLPIACAAARPQSLPGAEALATGAGGGGPASLCSLTPDHQLREDFTVLAKDLVATLKGVVSTLVCERGRLRAALDAAEAGGAAGGALTALRSNLSSALHQNSELRSRLSRIHDQSDLAEISSVHNSDPQNGRQFQQSLSYSSSCVSASEFFDAEEHDPPRHDLLPHDEGGVIELDGDSTSEAGSLSSEEGSASSDNSDGAMLPASELPVLPSNGAAGGWRRRARLPCPRPTPGGPSLWNLLYKNIGKDLSQVSMPVTINEPLNMLQRLCEELEYSSLLDSAAECSSAVERMALMAAFAVSAYAASAHRAASKPFNPLLAETYECIRDDRGFKFLAEQVSHHPPISACHAEAARWRCWQDARIKTKFWGKSMEFQPAGHVHVRLLPHGDHYSWNKVTTCVHNLFGGQRWVDQYGDMHITCHGTDVSAKLNFIKASSWSSSRHEVRGYVTEGSTGVRLRLQGRWSEALYAGEPPAARCLWRPGPMPPEHELYYGFTRFAMELNELEPGMRDVLPHTDTRLRPDQRALEEGDVEAAEQHKHRLEQAQRERRRDLPDHAPAWFRKSMEGGEEMWVFTGEYWKAREAGFDGHRAPAIW